MLIYDNEYEIKENNNWTKDKFEPQHVYYKKKVIFFVKSGVSL